jgi:hypothetical protein
MSDGAGKQIGKDTSSDKLLGYFQFPQHRDVQGLQVKEGNTIGSAVDQTNAVAGQAKRKQHKFPKVTFRWKFEGIWGALFCNWK